MTDIKATPNAINKGNEIQAELAEAIKTHNKATSRQNMLMVLLTGVLVFLTVVIIALTVFMLRTSNKETEIGRYAISASEKGLSVLDTKTSKLWLRYPGGNIYLGTNENPMDETIEQKQRILTFEEMIKDKQKQ